MKKYEKWYLMYIACGDRLCRLCSTLHIFIFLQINYLKNSIFAMEKILALIFLGIIMVSCNKCKEDLSFREFYFEEINKITEYDSCTLTGNPIPNEYWIQFYHNTTYLKFLTNLQFRYDATEPPGYASEEDLKADIKDLKRWYKENKCGMTKVKADSIENIKINSEIRQ